MLTYKLCKSGLWPFVFPLAIALGSLIVSGCSDNGSGGSGTGTLNDSPVQGVSYVGGTESGVTDQNGTFHYTGDRVSFSVGNIELGSGTPKAFMTLVDLVEGAVDETHPAVTNIACLLQSLDDDQNPSNGININQQVRDAAANMSVNFEQATEAFEIDSDVQSLMAGMTAPGDTGPRTLRDCMLAQHHLRDTLLGRFTGTYCGTFSGDRSGTFALTAGDDGTISGSATTTDTGGSEEFPLSGSISSEGVISFGGDIVGGTGTFSGEVMPDGSVAGTWESEGMTGTLEGTRDADGSCSDGSGGTGGGSAGIVRVVLNFEDPSQATVTVTPSAVYECSDPIADINCELHVFDIPGTDRYFQYLWPLGTCFGFDAVIEHQGTAWYLSGEPVRAFGSGDGPFASGTFMPRLGPGTGGTFEFYEEELVLPATTPCPMEGAEEPVG